MDIWTIQNYNAVPERVICSYFFITAPFLAQETPCSTTIIEKPLTLIIININGFFIINGGSILNSSQSESYYKERLMRPTIYTYI